MVKTVIEKLLGNFLGKPCLLVEIVEQRHVETSGNLHAVTEAAKNPRVYQLSRGGLFNYLQKQLLLECILGRLCQINEFANLEQISSL